MRITKVYTRAGDQGATRLVDGQLVSKNHTRIEAYGTVDELNSVLGMAQATLAGQPLPPAAHADLQERVQHIQNDLFDIGSDLATPPAGRWEGMPRIGSPDVERLERWIDEAQEPLTPLRQFILPTGGPLCAVLHLARTTCRRAERRVVTLVEHEPDTGQDCIRYLNRLSDLLFVWARWVAMHMGEPETFWVKAQERSPNA